MGYCLTLESGRKKEKTLCCSCSSSFGLFLCLISVVWSYLRITLFSAWWLSCIKVSNRQHAVNRMVWYHKCESCTMRWRLISQLFVQVKSEGEDVLIQAFNGVGWHRVSINIRRFVSYDGMMWCLFDVLTELSKLAFGRGGGGRGRGGRRSGRGGRFLCLQAISRREKAP